MGSGVVTKAEQTSWQNDSMRWNSNAVDTAGIFQFWFLLTHVTFLDSYVTFKVACVIWLTQVPDPHVPYWNVEKVHSAVPLQFEFVKSLQVICTRDSAKVLNPSLCLTALHCGRCHRAPPCNHAPPHAVQPRGGGRRPRRPARRWPQPAKASTVLAAAANKNSTKIFTIWFSCPLTNNVTMWHAWPNNFMGGLCGLYGLFLIHAVSYYKER